MKSTAKSFRLLWSNLLLWFYYQSRFKCISPLIILSYYIKKVFLFNLLFKYFNYSINKFVLIFKYFYVNGTSIANLSGTERINSFCRNRRHVDKCSFEKHVSLKVLGTPSSFFYSALNS